MATDGNKPQDGTMNATGTNNANVDFDARAANKGIFADFDRAVTTINRYLGSKGVEGEAHGDKSEKNKQAMITVTLVDGTDYGTVNLEIKNQLKMRRQQMTAYNVKFYLTFEDLNGYIINEEVLEFD